MKQDFDKIASPKLSKSLLSFCSPPRHCEERSNLCTCLSLSDRSIAAGVLFFSL